MLPLQYVTVEEQLETCEFLNLEKITEDSDTIF